jgi:hypothetical protein
VNESMSDLLDLASDDGGTSVGFSGETVARQARARQRRRHGLAAIGLTAAAVAGVLVATQVAAPSRTESQGPSTTTSTSPSSGTSPTVTPSLTAAQQAIVDQCARQHLPAPAVHVPTGGDGSDGRHQPQKGDLIQDSSAAGPAASFLKSWTLDASLQDDLGITATFVNPSHTRWASCGIAAGETQDADGVWTAPLPTGPVPRSWYGPNGFRHQGTTVSWSQVCAPGEGKVCGRELFAGALVRYAGVASAHVDAPDGTVLTPTLGRYTYVFRHAEQRVDPHRAANDMQALPSMPVTLENAGGKRIIRYDYFPPEILPPGCGTARGC